ncbi:SIP domain-containing protein [Actinomadura sediminis]|uniref:SIP domain-containing protein n=2 Tax=Actinomadura sediminis TaxID=1038904 RepID=A0ABW3F0U6_9ACTN
MPAALASGAEKLAARYAAVVVRNHRVSEHFVLLHCQGDRARHAPGDNISVRVGDRDVRHYTVLTAEPGRFGVLVDLAPDGPGARWARDVRPGTRVVTPPSGRPLRARPGRRHLVLGDGTALATVRAVTADVAAAGATAVSAVEAPAADHDAIAGLAPDVHLVPSAAAPGVALEDHLPGLLDAPFDHVYLVGHAQSVQRLRTSIRAATGMNRRSIHTRIHWADGRRGL